MKHKFFLLAGLMTALAIPQSVRAYDFCAISPSGHGLFYNIVNGEASVTYQYSGSNPGYSIYLSGDVEIPSSVTRNNIVYSVTSIGNSAFYNCSGITSITIPSSVSSIGENAFEGCNGLTTTNYSGSITGWCNIDFGNSTSNPIYRSNNLFISGIEVTNLIIPDSVTEIKPYAFYFCRSLISVSIPNTVTSIGDHAFYVCSNLATITIPDMLSSIGNYAFMYCQSLTTITFGNNLSFIGEKAFYACNGLEEINCLSLVPPTFGSNAFGNIATTIPVHIPCGRTALYQSQWSFFSNFIEPTFPSIILHSMDSVMGQAIIHTGPSCDSVTEIEAEANYGYHFTSWSDGVIDNPRTIILTQDTSFFAYFAKNQYSLAVLCNDSNLGSVSGSGIYDYLDTVEVSAVANDHYYFVQWDDGNTQNPRHYIVSGDDIIMATFAIDSHIVVLQVNNIAGGTVIGAGNYAYGTPATVSAMPYSGYCFSHWDNGSTYNPYTFAVLEDTELTADFYAIGEPYQDTITIYDTLYVYVHDTLIFIDTLWLHDTIYIHDTIHVDIGEAVIINAKVYQHNGQIVVDGAEGNTVTLYDLSGRMLATKHDEYMPIWLDVPASGTYMVKIGDYPARRVVVIK